jgi:hypothetical protein
MSGKDRLCRDRAEPLVPWRWGWGETSMGMGMGMGSRRGLERVEIEFAGAAFVRTSTGVVLARQAARRSSL